MSTPLGSRPRSRPRKPILHSYRSYGRRKGHVFSTTAAAARRRRARRVAWVLAIAGVAGVTALAWAWGRPVALAVTAAPADATISVAAGASACGTLTLDAVEPGAYTVSVARAGFVTETVVVDAARFRGANRHVALTPLPQRISVDAEPASARIRIVPDGAKEVAAEGSCASTLPAGAVRIEVSAPGCNTLRRSLFLDGPVALKLRLDPEGQQVSGAGHIRCAGAPKAVALTPDGSEAWATILDGPPSIEIFEPLSGRRVGEVDLGEHGAVEIVFSRDGRRAYASQMETAKVFEIDVTTRKVLRTLDTESSWTKVVALSPDGTTLYAANWSGDDVSVIDLKSGELTQRIPVADTPRGLWPTADGKTLWVASFGTGELERIDLATGEVETVFKNSGGALRHLVADEKRGVLFSSDMAKDRIWVTSMKSGVTRLFKKVGHKPNTIDLSPDGRVLFVSNRGENNSVSYYLPGPEWGSIMLIDARTAKPLDGIVGGNQCTALDVSDDGKTLVFSDFLDNRLRVYGVPRYATLTKGAPGRYGTLDSDVRK